MICMTLLMSGIFISFLIKYRKRQIRHKEELVQTEEELLQAHLEVQEQIRRHLATELHDNIGQLLSLTNATLASVDLQQQEKAARKITDAQELVKRSLQQLRQLSRVLHGEQVLEQGLAAAIRQEINWLQRSDYYEITFNSNIPEEMQFSEHNKNLVLFRLLQESISNIVKHAEASAIEINFDYMQDKLQLGISDNGNGFHLPEALSASSGGMGLNNMRKRAALIGGSLQIEAAPGAGTSIRIQVPYIPS
ncbi:sensor histidine kinase [Sediminibacterium ginsengisoli]|uniref:Oxygen sensor histidine kinase NreB n=1 Tax=Sediminibacterium ginsengisoli TaxID=413434 RepID=A0A1T4R2Y5_9BACT|nr:sensor histidine kinase [Sediminibacterium ginsengisoli]SKA10422.1 Histidine kinase [Sediminibacterium ginsengisoli]